MKPETKKQRQFRADQLIIGYLISHINKANKSYEISIKSKNGKLSLSVVYSGTHSYKTICSSTATPELNKLKNHLGISDIQTPNSWLTDSYNKIIDRAAEKGLGVSIKIFAGRLETIFITDQDETKSPVQRHIISAIDNVNGETNKIINKAI